MDLTTAAYRRCEAAAGSNVAQSQCLEDELRRQKALLDTAYRARSRDLAGEQQAALEKAQRAWIAFRDADCDAKIIRGGSGAALSWLSCMVSLTAARAREMETYGAW